MIKRRTIILAAFSVSYAIMHQRFELRSLKFIATTGHRVYSAFFGDKKTYEQSAHNLPPYTEKGAKEASTDKNKGMSTSKAEK